jgi:CHAT domain-containing protein
LAFHSIQQVTVRADSAEDLGRELVRAVPSGVTVVYQDLRSDQLATWVIRDGQVHFVATPLSAATLTADISQFRADLEAHNSAVVRGARHLYEVLLGPVREHITDSGLLIYSPASPLRGVPISALHDGEQFLAQRRAIGITRSLGTTFCRLRATSTNPDAALITLPAPPSNLPFLAGARYEATAVARIYGARATSLLGVDATPRAFLLMAPRFDVLHIGTHGRADGQPLQSAIDFGSERIRASEIMSIRLPHAPVVVLAGCRTDDETEGKTTITLSTAFITAGASAVVGSLWNVEDQSTARLMIDFHSHLSQGVSAAEALSLAQRSAIGRKENVASWAAFQVQM